jgi:hypothetical protein
VGHNTSSVGLRHGEVFTTMCQAFYCSAFLGIMPTKHWQHALLNQWFSIGWQFDSFVCSPGALWRCCMMAAMPH